MTREAFEKKFRFNDKHGLIRKYLPLCSEFDAVERSFDNKVELVGFYPELNRWITIVVIPKFLYNNFNVAV